MRRSHHMLDVAESESGISFLFTLISLAVFSPARKSHGPEKNV